MSFDFNGAPAESDPTADFLARERAAAGTLSGEADLFGGAGAGAASGTDKDFDAGASQFPALDGQEDDLLGGGGSSGGVGSFSGAPAPAPSQPAPALDERDQFERSFPQLEEEEELAPPAAPPANAASSNGFMAPPVQSNISKSMTPAPLGVTSDPYHLGDEEEPEPVRAWRETQGEEIARREAAAERRKGETISKAEQDIDNFYAEYNKKKEKNIAQNKKNEAEFLENRSRDLAEGTTWTRVTKLVDLQNSQSKTISRSGPGATDLTRMKEVLLSLRREGETAPGASGY
ncbi:hypothetical protein FA10DRAFT_264779 [Acaromyces ingoldii]|uniref:Clathrin light chain n=1 Tax=Acaromyces ingoldii TaxID=215250 RepID=A0A316YXP2_9BASI|nr:hypothetical protein FA10DRAFT_264779 [Acaromyces ingoldii]PWN94217.1 hypothetical protein FA10DRAFT_264779 [Acaromyces ingoldii]